MVICRTAELLIAIVATGPGVSWRVCMYIKVWMERQCIREATLLPISSPTRIGMGSTVLNVIHGGPSVESQD